MLTVIHLFFTFSNFVSKDNAKNISPSALINIYNVISSKNNWMIEPCFPKLFSFIKRKFFQLIIYNSFFPINTKLSSMLVYKSLSSRNVKKRGSKMKQKNKRKRLKFDAASLTSGRISVLRSRDHTEYPSLEKYRDTICHSTIRNYKKRIPLPSKPACACYVQYNGMKGGKNEIICFSSIMFYRLLSRHLG